MATLMCPKAGENALLRGQNGKEVLPFQKELLPLCCDSERKERIDYKIMKEMRKVFVFVLLGIVSLTANAQIFKTDSGTAEGSESKWVGEFNFYIQDAWGIGLIARKEFNKYIGWNVIGASFMSGWGQYETPDNVGIVNARLMGVRLSAPIYKKLSIFGEATPGYTYMYANVPVITWVYGGMLKTKAHCFGLDCCAGFQINKHLALGYNFSFFANKNGNSHIHWGRVSIIF